MNGRLVALSFGLLLAAARAGPEPPVFGTQAEIVTVDVVVLDSDGKPVPGLTRADFVVKEDGKAQTLTAFEVVEAPAAGIVAGETRRASAARVSTNAAGPVTRRTFAVVFDDLHVGPLRIEQAKTAVTAFVAREVRTGDRLLLFTTSDARYWSTTRGAEDGAWIEALARVRSRQRLTPSPACRITEYEAMRIEDFGDRRVCDMVSRRRQALGCMEDLLSCARVGGPSAEAAASAREPTQRLPSNPMAAAESHAAGRAARLGSLRAVREMVRAVAALAGRKEVVLVSEGFPLDPSMDVFREVRQEAARSNAAIHFLDPRGLTTGPDFLSAAATRGLPEAGDVALTMALWPLEDGGTKALAEETGGRVLQTNDLVAGLQQVADESRVTYLLGYEPTNDKRDGRYRKLKVDVTRPGLTVRARAGYFAGKGKTKPAPEPSAVDRALRNPFDADGIPLRLAAYVMGAAPLQSPVPKTGVEVLIAGEIRLDALATRPRDGRSLAEPKLTLLASSRSGESHESNWTLEIELARSVEGAAPAQAWHPFLTRIAMAPGDHRARLVAESGGKIGSVTVDFDVPGFDEERLSTPILSDRLVERPSGRGVMPVVRREFDRGTTLQCWLELHGAAKDDATGLARATAAFLARSSDGREWASGAAVEMKDEAGRLVRLVSLPLADATLDESEIVFTVHDEVSGRELQAREPFRVEGQAAGEAHAAAGSAGADRQFAPSVAAPPPPRRVLSAPVPTFEAEAQVVLLDLVARDGRGRLVSDLRGDEVEVFEDGRRCEVRSFRHVGVAGVGEGTPAPATVAAPPGPGASPASPVPSQANLVVLLFGGLYVEMAPYAREAALDLLGRTFPANTWFAVYKIGWHGTSVLQAFTSDRDRLRAAVRVATTGDDAGRGAGSTPPGDQSGLGAGSAAPASPVDLAARVGQVEVAHLRGMSEVDTFKGLGVIVRSLADVRGRKAVVYFAVDHELGFGEIGGGRASLVYAATMNDANRANVTIHTVDTRGLKATRVGDRSTLGQVLERNTAAYGGSGRVAAGPWTAATDDPAATQGPLLGDPDRTRGAAERFLSYRSGSLLEHVAEETGGLAIRNTNDLAAGLGRVIDEVREYYEVAYAPPNPFPDGRFRRIRARVTRPGVEVRTRAGYFAAPANTATMAADELPLLAALAEADPPRAFPHDVRLQAGESKGGDREVEFQAEVPLGVVGVTSDPARGTWRAHLTLLAFVKDEAGRPVARLGQDWPVEGTLDGQGRVPPVNLAFRRVLALPAGGYTVESAIEDGATGRISVARASVAP